MPNPIKYSTGSESLALKRGNFYIGTRDLGKGPTESTGYYNGITPPEGGYTIYLNKETGGPSIYTCANDSELISLTNKIADASYATANECLVYFAGQNDKMVLNRDYEGIVTDGLVLNIDAGFTPSYPGSGNTIYNIAPEADYPSMYLYGDTANYGSIGNGVVTLGGTSNNTSSGTILRGVGNMAGTVNSDFTSMGWQYRTSSKSGEILSYRESGVRLSFDIQNNSMTFYQREQVSPFTTNSTSVSVTNALNIWNHFALVRTGNSWSFYKNGSLVGTNTFTPTETLTGGVYFHIGAAWSDDDYLSNCMDGNVGPTMHYTRALTSQEIQQNYNAQKGRFGL